MLNNICQKAKRLFSWFFISLCLVSTFPVPTFADEIIYDVPQFVVTVLGMFNSTYIPEAVQNNGWGSRDLASEEYTAMYDRLLNRYDAKRDEFLSSEGLDSSSIRSFIQIYTSYSQSGKLDFQNDFNDYEFQCLQYAVNNQVKIPYIYTRLMDGEYDEISFMSMKGLFDPVYCGSYTGSYWKIWVGFDVFDSVLDYPQTSDQYGLMPRDVLLNAKASQYLASVPFKGLWGDDFYVTMFSDENVRLYDSQVLIGPDYLYLCQNVPGFYSYAETIHGENSRCYSFNYIPDSSSVFTYRTNSFNINSFGTGYHDFYLSPFVDLHFKLNDYVLDVSPLDWMDDVYVGNSSTWTNMDDLNFLNDHNVYDTPINIDSIVDLLKDGKDPVGEINTITGVDTGNGSSDPLPDDPGFEFDYDRLENGWSSDDDAPDMLEYSFTNLEDAEDELLSGVSDKLDEFTDSYLDDSIFNVVGLASAMTVISTMYMTLFGAFGQFSVIFTVALAVAVILFALRIRR